MTQKTYTLTHEQLVSAYKLWVTDLVKNPDSFQEHNPEHNPDDAEAYAEAFLYYLEQV